MISGTAAQPAESIFITVTRAAAEHGAINLAQGVLVHGPPSAVLDALRAVGSGAEHQYCPSAGHPALRAAVAGSVATFDGIAVDPGTEVTITAGATEAISCTLAALLEDGGEVIVIEPAYEQYRPVIEAAGGTVRAVTLATPDARVDVGQLTAVCGPQTRALVVNSPWNPWGRALTAAEWHAIATVAAERRIVVVSDETYEHLVLDSSVHHGVLSTVADPELRVKISSASKTLAVTGWRVGWAVGGPMLTARIRARHQFVTFCAPAPLQVAVAAVLGSADFPALRREIIDSLRERTDRFVAALHGLGLRTATPEAGFFVIADVGTDAKQWCLRTMSGGGVAALPVSAFFARTPVAASGLVRFALCKSASTLDDAIQRLYDHPTTEVTP